MTVLADGLERAVVDDDHGEGHGARELVAQTQTTRRRLLGAADDGVGKTLGNNAGNEVGAVVEQDARARVDHRLHVHVVLIPVVVARAEHGHAARAQECDDVVLSGPVVARGHDLGPARRERLEEHRRLGFEVERHADPLALEGSGVGKFFTGCRKQGHPRSDPFDACGAAGGQFSAHACTLHI